jgi:hypothetical protein
MNKFEKAVGLSGVYFSPGTTQMSRLGLNPTDDLGGSHLRWSTDKHLEYPRYGCQIFRTTGNVLPSHNHITDLALDDPGLAANTQEYSIQSNRIVFPIRQDGIDHGQGMVVLPHIPFQVDFIQRPEAFQLTLVGIQGEDVEIEIKFPGMPNPQRELIRVKHLEMKVVSLGLGRPIDSLRIKSGLAMLTRLELFKTGWHTFLLNNTTPILSHPLRVDEEEKIIRTRLKDPAMANLLVNFEDEIEMLYDFLVAALEDERAPYFRDFDVPNSAMPEHARTGEDSAHYRINAYDLLHIVSADAEMARMLGLYTIDDDPQLDGDSQAYVLTAHFVKPSNMETESRDFPDAASIGAVAYSDNIIPHENGIKLAQIRNFAYQDIRKLKSPELPGAAGNQLSWALSSGDVEPVLYELQRAQASSSQEDVQAFKKQMIQTDSSKQIYYDLYQPQGLKYNARADYSLDGFDAWGRKTKIARLKDTPILFDPTPVAPDGLEMDWDGPDLVVSFRWGSDHYNVDKDVNRFMLYFAGEHVRGIHGLIVEAVVEPNATILQLSRNAKIIPKDWALKINNQPIEKFSVLQSDPLKLQVNTLSQTIKPKTPFSLSQDWSAEQTWTTLRPRAAFQETLQCGQSLAPQVHPAKVSIDQVERRIYVEFAAAKTPFKGLTCKPTTQTKSAISKIDVVAGSFEQYGIEYGLEPVPGSTSRFLVTEVQDDFIDYIPESGDVNVYPRIHITFNKFKLNSLGISGQGIHYFAMAVRSKDKYGAVSVFSKRQICQWVDSSPLDAPTMTKPKTIPKASMSDYFGKSSYPFKWNPVKGASYHIYRTTDELLRADAEQKGLAVSWKGLGSKDEHERLKTLLTNGEMAELAESYQKISDDPVAPTSYTDSDIDGRARGYYLYKISAVNQNGVESPLSKIAAVVRSPAASRPATPAILSARPVSKGIVVTWQHIPDKDLDYYALMRSAAKDLPDHWRGYKTRFKILPNENTAPLLVMFNMLDLSILPEDAKVDGVFDRTEVEDKLYKPLDSKVSHAGVTALGLENYLKTDRSNLVNRRLVDLPVDIEGQPMVICYTDSQTDVIWELNTQKSYLDKTAMDPGKKYHYRLIAVSHDEKQISPLSVPISAKPL